MGKPDDPGKLPVWLKVAVTLWAAILVPSYALDSGYGLLWFCNVGLILTVIALWTENPLLVSMPAIGNVPWLLLWCLHLAVRLVELMFAGGVVDGPASYMFNAEYPLYARVLSIYHGWMPFVLLYALRRVGYDRRAFVYQTFLAWVLVISAWAIVPNAQTRAGNVNMVFGYTADRDPVLWVSQPVWVVILLIFIPLVLYLSTHWVYRRVFQPAKNARITA